MILLNASALLEAQVDHFRDAPTHAKLVRYHVISISGDMDLLSQASDMKDRIEGTYVYGTLDENGAFIRTPRTPFIPVILPHASSLRDVPTPITSEGVVINTGNISDTMAHNSAVKATQHILAPGVVPHPEDPTQPLEAPGKPAWHFRDVDFDAVASMIDKRLSGKVV